MNRKFSISIAAVILASALAGCMTQAKELDLSLDRTSAGAIYHVTLLPPERAPAINQLHSWKVKLENQSGATRSEEHTSELQSLSEVVCRLLLEKKKKT